MRCLRTAAPVTSRQSRSAFRICSRMGNARFEVMGDFGRYDTDVAVRCDHCRHKRFLTTAQVYTIFGMETRIAKAQRRLRCSQCGGKGGRFAPIPRLAP
ncbi:hypothetical protein SCH01S_14_00300 [Sphingomonas changbaiensis NBRC 104936]|uniref:Uncharacterized protein n=1 Tax=Sphingomonas changbaiensis NBRC 104936 TaxID=1219043 RepID=A0A0E9MMM9_9SPHN|nr:hypothetical protein SCH01S_14_00300 [Sphingomonas changbaiensis NBRC 104936]